MKREGRKKFSIRWTFFWCCIILVVIMLVMVWTVRLLFVESTYRQVRIAIAEGTSEELKDVVEEGRNFKTIANDLASNSDTTVILLDGNGNIIHTSHSDFNNFTLTPTELADIRNYAMDSGKNKFSREIEIENNSADKNNKMLIYAQNIEIGEHIEGIGPTAAGMGTIVLCCRVLPMAPTIQTINFELMIVSLVMIAVTFVFALLLAKYLSRPLEDISAKASKLAKGDYSVRFSEQGYREVAELGETLNYTTDELAKNDSMRRDLIANVSHDLRTPLTMIRGYVEMMRDIPNENNSENMNVILKETDYLSNLVRDMLDISKLEANAVRFKVNEFDINDLLVEIANRYNALYKQQKYTFDYNPIGHKVIVCSDKVMITNVIYNLMNNAVNHIGDDHNVQLVTKIEGGKITIHVIDHGEGIEADKLATIWDRYYKAERNLKRESAGSGLGLSIVKTVLTKLGCTYGVDSTLGEGSDFYMTIDIVREEYDPSDEAENRSHRRTNRGRQHCEKTRPIRNKANGDNNEVSGQNKPHSEDIDHK